MSQMWPNTAATCIGTCGFSGSPTLSLVAVHTETAQTEANC